jgi:hypothetical protein
MLFVSFSQSQIDKVILAYVQWKLLIVITVSVILFVIILPRTHSLNSTIAYYI